MQIIESGEYLPRDVLNMQQTPARQFSGIFEYCPQIVASVLHDNPRFKNGRVLCVRVCVRVCVCVLRAGVGKHVVQ